MRFCGRRGVDGVGLFLRGLRSRSVRSVGRGFEKVYGPGGGGLGDKTV
jgi:hypothetical protein